MDPEKLRDEKCIPIAQEILKDLATDLIPTDANEKIDYGPITLKILKRTLDSDLNIATENTYLFQLILGALSGLNSTVQSIELEPLDEIKYGRISNKILDILASSNVKMGTVTPEETQADFEPVKEKLVALFAEEKINKIELKYIIDNIFDSYKTVSDNFHASIEASTLKASEKLFKLEFMSDLTMKKLDDVLTSEVK